MLFSFVALLLFAHRSLRRRRRAHALRLLKLLRHLQHALKLLDSPLPPRTCFEDPEAPAGHSATSSEAVDSNTQCFPTCFEAPEVPARHSATCPAALNPERASRSFAQTGLFFTLRVTPPAHLAVGAAAAALCPQAAVVPCASASGSSALGDHVDMIVGYVWIYC